MGLLDEFHDTYNSDGFVGDTGTTDHLIEWLRNLGQDALADALEGEGLEAWNWFPGGGAGAPKHTPKVWDRIYTVKGKP